MDIALIGLIIFLIIFVIGLIIYNISIYKKVKSLSNTHEKIANLRVLQDFMDTIGKDTSVEDKIKIINDILIDKYNIKYSTIVVFNGAEYILKASNVDKRFWNTMSNLHTNEVFKDSIQNAMVKYITVDNPKEKLSYQREEMTRAKSAMFFPLYIDNIYIGYWIMESEEPHAFDGIDTGILEIVRENIISVLKTISYQNTLENIYRVDKFTGLNSAEYLYGKGKLNISKYAKSTVCMFTINNIEEVNEEYGRKVGTELIVKLANSIKTNIALEYIFVRYMGPKFAIVFSGLEMEDSLKLATQIKQNIDNIKVLTKDKKQIRPITNFVLGTYYKGTGLEEVTKKLEEYLDNSEKTQSEINYI